MKKTEAEKIAGLLNGQKIRVSIGKDRMMNDYMISIAVPDRKLALTLEDIGWEITADGAVIGENLLD